MKLYSLDMPETHEARIDWLESVVTGILLPEVVGELQAVHGGVEDAFALDEEDLESVLNDGLSALAEEQIQELLKNPVSLFVLQEEIATRGAGYWQAIAESVHDEDDFSFVEPKSVAQPQALPSLGAIDSDSNVTLEKPLWFFHPVAVSLATAVVVFFAVSLLPDPRPSKSRQGAAAIVKSGWGWSRDDALDRSLPDVDYMRSLADAAGEWFNKRPRTPSDLASRISDFRKGCSRLILASHAPLAADDREWLVGKCRAWAVKLDNHLADIESGRLVDVVLPETDRTIERLIEALRNKALEMV